MQLSQEKDRWRKPKTRKVNIILSREKQSLILDKSDGNHLVENCKRAEHKK